MLRTKVIGKKGFLMEDGKKNLIRFKLFFNLSFGGMFIFGVLLSLNFLNTFWGLF